MTRRGWNAAAVALLALGAIAASPPAPSADDPARAVDARYGKELAAAAASADAADDLALAARLLADASVANVQPALVRLLCEKAYDLAAKQPEGFQTAVDAMALLARNAPAEAAACQDRILDVHQNRYAKGRGPQKVKAGEALAAAIIEFADARAAAKDFDGAVNLYRRAVPLAATLRDINHHELRTKLDYATTRQGFQSQAEKLKAVLRQDPKNKAARDELVRIYVVEFDDPVAATRQLDLDVRDTASKYVLLAGMAVERLPRRACAELGHWYRRLAEQSSAQGRLLALVRAKGYYERYLALKDDPDDRPAEVSAALAEVDAVLAKVAASLPALNVVALEQFEARFGPRFPPAANLGSSGAATASSHWGNRLPENVFQGARTDAAWSLNGPEGWFLARWDAAPRGRYLLLFARSGTADSDSWGAATISVNGATPQKVDGMTSGRVLIVDLGIVVPVSSVRLAITGMTYPGLSGIEIHPDSPPAAPASDR